MDSRITWDSQVPIDHPDLLMGALRAAGLPLANSSESGEGDSAASDIVCVATTCAEGIHAVVAAPSGLVWRFEPPEFEVGFWQFAARNYYWVTGNMTDRKQVAEMTGVPVKDIKGRALLRAKDEGLSGVSLDALLERLGCSAGVAQTQLF